MPISHLRLPGLDEAKILALVEPVLSAHQVDGVELMFRGDRDGKVLILTIEKPGAQKTGEGITVDLCAEMSRDLSEKFDELDVIPGNYRLEVGSPGVERPLYLPSDYHRFRGQEVKLKLHEPSDKEGFIGQKTVRGVLFGLDPDGRAELSTDHGNLSFSLDEISSARLVFSWNQSGRSSRHKKRPPARNLKTSEPRSSGKPRLAKDSRTQERSK